MVFSHGKDIYSEYSDFWNHFPKTWNFICDFLGFGIRGVSLFFAISGFIIATKLFRELNASGTISLKAFYLRRVFRILPVSVAVILMYSLLNILGYNYIPWLEILSCLLSFRNYGDLLPITLTSVRGSHMNVFWSLSIEEHFYFLLPSFILLLKKNRRYFIGIILVCILSALWRKLGTMDSFLAIIPWGKYSFMYTFGRLDALGWGVVLAYFYINKKEICYKYLAIIPTSFIIIAILAIYYLPIPFKALIESLLFPLLINSTIVNPTSLWSRFLETTPLKFMGKISYSLYLWHPFFLYPLTSAPRFFNFFSGHWYSFPMAILFSYLSYKYIEKPFLNYRKNKFHYREY